MTTPLDPKLFARVKAEHCLASYVGGGVNLYLMAVIEGNVASYKLISGKNKVLYAGPSSQKAAETFNETLAAKGLIEHVS